MKMARRDIREDRDRADAPRPAEAVVDPPLRYRSTYSRFVLLAKVVLPLIAGVVMVLVVIWPELKGQPEGFHLGISDIRIETAGGQRLVNARFTGLDGANRPFSVTSDSVRQAPDGKGVFDLQQPKADITLDGSRWVALTAPEGTYRRDSQRLDLRGGVDLFHDDGHQFRTAAVDVDIAKGTAIGNDPVHGQGPFGTIDGDGIRIVDRGERILVTGRSRLVLYPDAPKGGAAPPAATKPATSKPAAPKPAAKPPARKTQGAKTPGARN
jgi:lipopolysaccharide export system protein LptC